MDSRNIPAPAFPRLSVTVDPHGDGQNDNGVAYRTFDVSRPAMRDNFPRILASITVYADDTPAIVWDRYTGDHRAGDLKAIAVVRDGIRSQYPNATHGSYRYA